MYRGKGFQNDNSSGGEGDLTDDFREAYHDGRLREFPKYGKNAEFPIEVTDPDSGQVTVIVARPDWRWDGASHILQLDGPHHLHSECRDRYMDELERGLGWTVKREPYEPPLSKRLRKRILEETIETVNKSLAEISRR